MHVIALEAQLKKSLERAPHQKSPLYTSSAESVYTVNMSIGPTLAVLNGRK